MPTIHSTSDDFIEDDVIPGLTHPGPSITNPDAPVVVVEEAPVDEEPPAEDGEDGE